MDQANGPASASQTMTNEEKNQACAELFEPFEWLPIPSNKEDEAFILVYSAKSVWIYKSDLKWRARDFANDPAMVVMLLAKLVAEYLTVKIVGPTREIPTFEVRCGSDEWNQDQGEGSALGEAVRDAFLKANGK